MKKNNTNKPKKTKGGGIDSENKNCSSSHNDTTTRNLIPPGFVTIAILAIMIFMPDILPILGITLISHWTSIAIGILISVALICITWINWFLQHKGYFTEHHMKPWLWLVFAVIGLVILVGLISANREIQRLNNDVDDGKETITVLEKIITDDASNKTSTAQFMPSSTVAATSTPSPSSTPTITVTPSPVITATSTPETFSDDFNGGYIDLNRWIPKCGGLHSDGFLDGGKLLFNSNENNPCWIVPHIPEGAMISTIEFDLTVGKETNGLGYIGLSADCGTRDLRVLGSINAINEGVNIYASGNLLDDLIPIDIFPYIEGRVSRRIKLQFDDEAGEINISVNKSTGDNPQTSTVECDTGLLNLRFGIYTGPNKGIITGTIDNVYISYY